MTNVGILYDLEILILNFPLLMWKSYGGCRPHRTLLAAPVRIGCCFMSSKNFAMIQNCYILSRLEKKKISLTEGLWQYHPKRKQYKWKFSTFCGLPETTSYPYLQLRMIGHPGNSRHPQGGVQIYPHPNLQHNKENKSTLPQIAIFISCSPWRKKNI